MVSSLDGAAAAGGLSGSIGGAGDRLMFGAIRRLADTIVVGAGTARAERYRMPPTGVRLIMVSRSLDLPDDLPALVTGREGGARPVIIAPSAAPADRAARLSVSAEVILVEDDPSPAAIISVAADLGAEVISCEGGPSLLAQFDEADLIDEWFVTIGNCVLSGAAPRILSGGAPSRRDLELVGLVEDDSTVFLRYLTTRDRLE